MDVCACMYAFVCANLSVSVCVHSVCICAHLCVCAGMCVYVYVCILRREILRDHF